MVLIEPQETVGATADTLGDCLNLFNYDRLSPEQDTIIRAAIARHDVLGVLPTGGGKSACFQIPGIVTRDRTLVVSPLIALQEDQIAALRKLGIKAFALHSNMDESRKQAVHYYFKSAPRDEPSFLYLSPELLMTEMFHSRFDSVGFSRIAVDEAHCVSTWGNSFRPDYQRIRVATMRLNISHCSAFTATVDPRIEADIRKRTPLRKGYLRVASDPMRPNLELQLKNPVGHIRSGAKGRRWIKFQALIDTLGASGYAGPSIVYFSSRDEALYVYDRYATMGGTGWRGTPYLFHSTLPYDDKRDALTGFRKDERPIVFATSAFGMGINRSDVRQIIHYSTPITLIDYAQQIGRGGRDGLPALCTAFHDRYEYESRLSERIQFLTPDYDFVERVHERLYKQLEKLSPAKRRGFNVQSFARRVQAMIERDDTVPEYQARRYLDKMNVSLAILQRVGYIHEGEKGLTLHAIEHGSPRHLALIEKTEMYRRMQERESARIAEFFSENELDQRKLWEILKRKETLPAK